MTLRALIFDVDGTLAETEETHRAAFNASFAAFGLDWHWDQPTYARLLKVTGGKERMRAYQPGLSDELIVALHREKTKAFGKMLAGGQIALRPGVTEIIKRAKEQGLQLAVATTTSPENIEALCQACWGQAATQVFEVIAAGDDVAAKKPAPDVYLLALARLGVTADDALAFEDSRNGVLSAQAAGLRVVVTPGIYTLGEDFAGAVVYPSLQTAAETGVDLLT